uniref:JmjC domain-containing protein 5 n=1 Tax=Ascaris suum TaxID=6253 RepID=F1L073_ASCSU
MRMEEAIEEETDLVLEDFVGSGNDQLLTECFAIRREVFMIEQGVEESLEFDGLDDDCLHVVAKARAFNELTSVPPNSNAPDRLSVIATCRLRRTEPFLKLERVAVRKSWRGKGIGNRICCHAIKLAEQNDRSMLLVVQAQTCSLQFYEKLGFITISDVYDEAGIPHRTMIYWPRRNVTLALDKCDDSIARHSFIAGECFDPSVIRIMRERIRIERENCHPRLLHLRFEVNELVVGSSLLRIYRECAFATQRCDFERSEKLERFLLTLAWEKLNSGHYSQVNDAWRALYSATAACKACRLYAQNKLTEALRACDMGLIMGGDIDGRSLSAFANHIHSLCTPPTPLIIKKRIADEPEPLSNSRQIRRISCPSLEEFFEFFARGEPVVMTGVVSQWPAFSKWSFDYFNSMIGHRTVPVEVGSSYADDGWSQSLTTVAEFMHEFIENESSRGVGYLAQHRLFDQVPELLDDVIVPDYCAFGEESLDRVDLNIWVGPAGTVSPLHTDPKSNIFCQVYGRKFLRLIPYSETVSVYPHEEGFLTNTSQVDVEHPDVSRYPLLKLAHVSDCVLSAGECLFIPHAFWHYVKSLEPSISVSCWFSTPSSSN